MNVKNKDNNHYWLNPEKQRYYHAVINQDLFGDWVVTKTWGGLGKRSGNIKHVACSSQETAMLAVAHLDKLRQKRGYQLIVNFSANYF